MCCVRSLCIYILLLISSSAHLISGDYVDDSGYGKIETVPCATLDPRVYDLAYMGGPLTYSRIASRSIKKGIYPDFTLCFKMKLGGGTDLGNLFTLNSREQQPALSVSMPMQTENFLAITIDREVSTFPSLDPVHLSDGKWHSVCIVCRVELSLYIDNLEVDSSPAQLPQSLVLDLSTLNPDYDDLVGTLGEGFVGMLGDVNLYGRAFTPRERRKFHKSCLNDNGDILRWERARANPVGQVVVCQPSTCLTAYDRRKKCINPAIAASLLDVLRRNQRYNNDDDGEEEDKYHGYRHEEDDEEDKYHGYRHDDDDDNDKYHGYRDEDDDEENKYRGYRDEDDDDKDKYHRHGHEEDDGYGKQVSYGYADTGYGTKHNGYGYTDHADDHYEEDDDDADDGNDRNDGDDDADDGKGKFIRRVYDSFRQASRHFGPPRISAGFRLGGGQGGYGGFFDVGGFSEYGEHPVIHFRRTQHIPGDYKRYG